MQYNILSRTRNHDWIPNRLVTRKYSTLDRLDNILNRSMIYGYIKLAYDADRILFLRDIKSDLNFEINDIRTSEIKLEGLYPSDHDGMEVNPEKMSSILAICDILLGNVKSSIDADLSEVVVNKFYLALIEYYNMIYKKQEGIETIKSIDNVYIKGLSRSGLSVSTVSQPGKIMPAVVTLNSTVYSDRPPMPNILDFMSCVSFINATTDTYLVWLASLCIEPDKNMIEGRAHFAPFDFINKWFSPMTIDETIHTLAKGCSIKDSTLMVPDLREVTQILLRLRERQGISLGRCTHTVLNAALGASNYIDKDIAYVLEVLTSKNVPIEDDGELTEVQQESVKAFQQSELYTKELDITSEYFIQVAAKEDEELPPDEEDPDEEDPIEDPEEEDPMEDDPEEDPIDPEEEPTEDPTEEPSEPEEETVVPKKVNTTNDKKGIIITIQDGSETLDEYLYKREVGYALTRILENPPEKMSGEKLAILKDIKTHWLYIFDAKTLHETLSKIIDLKIKVKTKEVA